MAPILEEMFFRGYVQSRLAVASNAVTAVVVTAILFTISHLHYIQPNPIAIGALVGLFFSSLLVGYVRYLTGSIWPGVLAHALSNVPAKGLIDVAILLAMLALVFLWRARVVAWLKGVVTVLRVASWAGAALMLAMMLLPIGLALLFVPARIVIVLVCLLITLGIHRFCPNARDRARAQ